MRNFISIFLCVLLFAVDLQAQASFNTWIRINQLGYPRYAIKVAVWCSKDNAIVKDFELVDAKTKQVVYKHQASKNFGAYGPFVHTARFDFSKFVQAGRYFLRSGTVQSPEFPISDTVYKGAADFCLRYMRQQRSGFNPFLKDSCHRQYSSTYCHIYLY